MTEKKATYRPFIGGRLAITAFAIAKFKEIINLKNLTFKLIKRRIKVY